MKTEGIFIYKTLETRQAGKFTDDSGNTIEYPEAYVMKVDEWDDKGKMNERKFKFDIQNQTLASKLRGLEPYEKVKIKFDVEIFANNARMNPYDVELVK